ncbi:hypothetical protein EDEG_03659 [Edhazardia aedis USNM 41457]|uniref:Structural maintenance of chromosomes protein 5 n=1 Tax=Edhazardia aedis (strain USNM 41457) TaxID=1003232 RepID=J9DGY0_EDHAE|nr:hypothetical protein EDEG_03659 [Edhazardia aedis USNM 41457]|eukprot:EJW01860.1 hypothetical protein EDEG_03659 [Edhazardia aedis USNM 41457]
MFHYEITTKLLVKNAKNTQIVNETSNTIKTTQKNNKFKDIVLNSQNNNKNTLSESIDISFDKSVQVNHKKSQQMSVLDFIKQGTSKNIYHYKNIKNWRINIMVKYRENEKLSILSACRQSGGEKSVATMLFLLSILKLNKSVFKIVDEINQGMDRIYERKVLEIITTLYDKDILKLDGDNKDGTNRDGFNTIEPTKLENIDSLSNSHEGLFNNAVKKNNNNTDIINQSKKKSSLKNISITNNSQSYLDLQSNQFNSPLNQYQTLSKKHKLQNAQNINIPPKIKTQIDSQDCIDINDDECPQFFVITPKVLDNINYRSANIIVVYKNGINGFNSYKNCILNGNNK